VNCIVCNKRPAELPDRDRMGSKKRVCLECHRERLRRDLLVVNNVARRLRGWQ